MASANKPVLEIAGDTTMKIVTLPLAIDPPRTYPDIICQLSVIIPEHIGLCPWRNLRAINVIDPTCLVPTKESSFEWPD